LLDRQHRDREVIGEIALVLVGRENDNVMPASPAIPRDFDAIALQAAAWEKLHDRECNAHRRNPEGHDSEYYSSVGFPTSGYMGLFASIEDRRGICSTLSTRGAPCRQNAHPYFTSGGQDRTGKLGLPTVKSSVIMALRPLTGRIAAEKRRATTSSA
jgi:hypothetical protein